jgi:hypothetical protein
MVFATIRSTESLTVWDTRTVALEHLNLNFAISFYCGSTQ